MGLYPFCPLVKVQKISMKVSTDMHCFKKDVDLHVKRSLKTEIVRKRYCLIAIDGLFTLPRISAKLR